GWGRTSPDTGRDWHLSEAGTLQGSRALSGFRPAPPTRTCFRFWKSSQYSYLLGRSPPWKGEPWMALRKWARSSARNDPKEWRSRAGTDCSFSQKSEAHPADKKMGLLTWAGSTSSSETLDEFSSLKYEECG